MRSPPTHRFWISLSVLGLLAALSLPGCADDPYSQRRIGIRMNHLNGTISDIERRERSCVPRLEEAGQTFEKWWRSDTERFQRHAASIGDYIW